MQGSMAIVCAAVVGPLNNPLYLKCFRLGSEEEEELRFHYIVHCALDAIDEKVSTPKRAPNEVNDSYLGVLYPTEDFKVHGYVSSTRVKLVVVTEKGVEKDSGEMGKVFKKIYHAYVNAASNPFYTPGQPLMSPKFDKTLASIVNPYTQAR